VREVLAARGVGPDFRFRSEQAGTELDFVHRSSPEAEIYFVHNKKRRWEEFEAEFRVKGRQPELWDAATGERRDQTEFESTSQGTRFTLRLEPEGSIFVVFRRPGRPKPARTMAPPASPARAAVPGPWTVRFTGGPAAPEPLQLAALRSWTASSDPKERHFSGIAEYETDIEIPAGWIGKDRRVILDLGSLWAVADVRLNGRDLGVVWKLPFRVDLSSAARAGKNRLLVRVANNWVNRLAGDGALPEAERTTRTNVLATGVNVGAAWRDVRLRESGLMGPVSVVVEPALR
jgi:hypothetical protein